MGCGPCAAAPSAFETRPAHDLVGSNVLAALALVHAGAGDPHRPRRVPDRTRDVPVEGKWGGEAWESWALIPLFESRDVRVVGLDVLAFDHVTRDLDDRRRDGGRHLAGAHLFEHWLEVAPALLVPAGGESGASEA